MMRVRPGGGTSALREGASAVSCNQRASHARRHDVAGTSYVEWLRLRTQNDRDDLRVAGETSSRLTRQQSAAVKLRQRQSAHHRRQLGPKSVKAEGHRQMGSFATNGAADAGVEPTAGQLGQRVAAALRRTAKVRSFRRWTRSRQRIDRSQQRRPTLGIEPAPQPKPVLFWADLQLAMAYSASLFFGELALRVGVKCRAQLERETAQPRRLELLRLLHEEAFGLDDRLRRDTCGQRFE